MKSVSDTVRLRLAGIAIVAGALALPACGKKEPEATKAASPSTTATTTAPTTAASPPAASADRDIKITSMQPDNTSLIAGQTVKLAISAAYALPPEGGSVGIVVQDAKSTLVANKLIPVKGGSGTVSEEIEFKVPATDRLKVHVPLYVKDEKKSVNVSSREYTVRPK